ncbi:ClC family H(+)/Cl(-) exchange transporter [Calidifontibacter sp. DB0510]|uniref:ClC family H(+)/Cl(-) exchange transporter n=1 Tax=Metallococcus carri TaxID=1656884 RepID=A0A967E8Z1_9MICO|nr:ClC family H(+)/Cl(-) exchange transporter [Metallococcus carri]NHN54675.1 ClC family H(+)/Cl(-) exchange transporter [Metallococcus carri]NOP37020.1 ClC family H(+)/Cl(-) exchange transporter [Calidifontibacter sp. DB2511S]
MSTSPARTLHFTLAAAVIGVLTGIAAASFAVVLRSATVLRGDLIRWSHASSPLTAAVVIGLAAVATATAAWLVHRIEPHAEGSGIPRVEAVVEGRTEPGRPRILPVKYLGGLLSIGSGLALGREGPSVQMGGNIGVIVARAMGCTRDELRVLVAGGAAAGLATAFSAPIAGGVFVLEELLKRFDPRTTIATLVSSATGFASARVLFGLNTDFHLAPLAEPRLSQAPLVLAVGLLTGVAGALYNRLVMLGLRVADRSRIHVVVRALAIGAAVGTVAWFAPDLVGGGDLLTQRALLGEGTVLAVCGVLLARTILGVVSYAAAVPGGLFAPMLVLGTHLGLLVGLLGHRFMPGLAPEPAALALIGMAAFFASSVRAPVTGIILATEMTGSVVLLPPMLGACAIAMLVAMMMRSTPIYDALTERAALRAAENEAAQRAGLA